MLELLIKLNIIDADIDAKKVIISEEIPLKLG
jgi:hypothetical protein